ncbi:hypothetical protein [Methylobacterium iners]|uniref:Phage protein n=1 Tax=Methylobacterium iners TaxID=418707 RepID=A0ABQ4RZ37_9HYPH|nr:hypothetical protein [Methylobacterium iners]GJD94785.1 hypothetical protein OCOJLMKI_1989 [Methylobacterium iners]
MKLFKIIAKWADSDGIENQDLYVRAEDAAQAFNLWVNYYEKDEDGPYTLADAKAQHDVEWRIKELKTYIGFPNLDAGVIQWDDYERILIAAL